MLDQYNKDFPQHDHDHIPNENSGNKKKIALALSGATLALVFFLFLMGIFRTDDSGDDSKNSSQDSAGKNSGLVALDNMEEKICQLQKRLDRIELDHMKLVAQDDTKIAQASADQDPDLGPEQAVNPPQNTPATPSYALTHEGAVSMANQAMLSAISTQANNSAIAADDDDTEIPLVPAAPSPKQPPARPTAAAPTTTSKQPSQTAPSQQSPQGEKYIVRKGDTLSKISKKFYGTPNLWRRIYQANRDRIPNMDSLKVGTPLIIPPKHQK